MGWYFGRKAVFVDAFTFLVHDGQMISGFDYGACFLEISGASLL